MKYQPLFNLEIRHGYYTDGVCPDLRIEPTPGAAQTLQNFRCVLKPIANGLRVLVPVNEKNAPFIAIPKKTAFRFHLFTNNPAFSLFTDLGEFERVNAPLYTQPARAGSPNLELVSQKARAGEVFTVQNPALLESFTLAGRPAPGARRSAFRIQSQGPAITVEKYAPASQTIFVDSSRAARGSAFTVTYPIVARLERGALAAIEIKCSSSQENPTFVIDLQPRQARWKYYILTDPSDTATLPGIEDKDKALGFDPGNSVNLTLNPDPADTIAQKLAQQYPNKLCFRLLSNALVPCQQAARKNLQLFIKEQKIIESLPNPALENFSVDTRNTTQEYTLYQVVKYFSY